MDWQFYEQNPTDTARNPIGGEFFSTEAVKDITDAVVREAIQNSIDARSDGDSASKKTARVRIFVSENDAALAPDRVRRWFKNLWPHILAPGNGLREQPTLDEPCKFLVIEDFGTTGLTGDPTTHEIVPEVKNHFLNFFRAEGHSDKSGEKGGSWGIGKNAFPRASRINTYFGYTARNSDGKTLLFGRSIIKFHHLNHKSYKSDGYWGIKREDGFMLPVSDETVLEEFSRDFSLKRVNEPGLSIVIPWYDTDEANAISFESLLEAVSRGFFFPIQKGILEVDICAPDREILLTSSSLLQQVEAHSAEIPALNEVVPVIKLANWMETLENSDHTITSSPPPEKAQKWEDVKIDDNDLNALRTQMLDGQRCAVQVEMAVCQLGGQPVTTHFGIYFESSLKSHKPVFIRDELVIPDVKAPAVPGVRSLVVINDPPIATLLRLAETPAHTQWSAGTDNFKKQYKFGPGAINFVSKSVTRLMAIVNKSDKEADPSLTIDFFSIPAQPENGNRQRDAQKPQPKPGAGPSPDSPEIPINPKRFRLQSRQGGFTILPGEAEWEEQMKMRIKLAYDVRRGNPFTRYNSLDFDVKDMKETLELDGAILEDANGNVIEIKIHDPLFRIAMNGFDPMRDLIVNAKVIA